MKKPGRIAPFFVALVCVLALVTSGCGMFGGGEEEQPGGQQGEDVPVLPVAQAGEEVVAEGEVVPVRSVELRFEQSGIVDEILVEEGSTVETGAELARLDTRDMVLAVEESEALLKQSKADYDLLVEGATDEEIAIAEISVEIAKANLDVYEALLASQRASVKSAEAEVARAQANLMQVRGAVTPADIASAEHSLEQAQLELADELDGPKATDVQQSQAALDQAVTNLREARDTLSSQKTSAYLEMQVAANNLRDRQLGYSDTVLLLKGTSPPAADLQTPRLESPAQPHFLRLEAGFGWLQRLPALHYRGPFPAGSPRASYEMQRNWDCD